jgi:hypothetical protein
MSEQKTATDNALTVYQNGVGAFTRTFAVPAEKSLQVRLPFKKAHIGDVAATLDVRGSNIEITESAHYSTNKEKPSLEINPLDATKDIFTKLSGADVSVTLKGHSGEQVKGKALGFSTENAVTPQNLIVTTHWLTVQQSDGSIRRINYNEVENYVFTDEKVRTLINKALAYNVEKLAPESVFLNMTLKGKAKEGKAVLNYVIPSPAFKLSYRIKQRDKKNWKLYGFCVVDNNTDEDWTDFNIACATGQPVTFPTNIADVCIPDRGRKVSLVNSHAIGAVEAESGFESVQRVNSSRSAKSATKNFAPAMASGGAMPAPMAAMECCDYSSESIEVMDDIFSANATATEVGDSTIFKSISPVTIPAHESAIIPVLDVDLTKAEFCLYYQPNKSQNIMRTLKMTNEGDTLSRGVVSIEQEATHVGLAMLSNTRQGETAMLCHALESGVTVLREQGNEKSQVMQHKLTKGLLTSEWTKTRTTVYTFRNTKSEAFTLFFDHSYCYTTPTVTVTNTTVDSKLKDNAVRYTTTIPANESVTVSIKETTVTQSSLKADGFFDWMTRNPDSPLLAGDGMQKLINLTKELDSLNKQLASSNEKLKGYNAEQDRLRKNLEVLKTGADAEKMRNRLSTTENEIVTLQQTTIPSLNEQIVTLKQRMQNEVLKTSATWKA